MLDLAQLAQHLIDGHHDQVARLTRQALDEGIPPAHVLEHGLIAGMKVVGERFRDQIIFLPDVLVAARAMKAGMAHLDPVLSAGGIAPRGTMVIGTVKGDIHDIGKNLVAIMLKGSGWQVIDLGINVPLGSFTDAVRRHQPDLVAMSALLTTTMQQMQVNITALRQAGLLERTRVMVGGAPLTREYARTIGADAYAPNATAAVTCAHQLLSELEAGKTRLSS